MSLPTAFPNRRSYFDAAVSFLNSHAWIYQHANTCIISGGVLDRFPSEYVDFFLEIKNVDLNRFPFVYQTELSVDTPESLKDFRSKLQVLIPEEAFGTLRTDSAAHSVFTSSLSPGAGCLSKMKPKKQHEIVQLSQVINRYCSDNNVLIDFGAGLGYLSEMLYTKSDRKYLILGLEADCKRVAAAEKRRREHLPHSANAIVYKQVLINDASAPRINIEAHNLALLHGIQKPEMAIIGLHACADLTISAMRLFFQLNAVRQLIIMPCCYHKLQMMTAESNAEKSMLFANFPLSSALKSALLAYPCPYLNRPFLRLACQQTTERWRDCSDRVHAAHGRNLFLRGVAEAILDRANEKVVKQMSRKRDELKDSHMDLSDISFAELCSQYALRSKLTKAPIKWNAEHEKNFNKLMCQYGPATGPILAEALICLQTAMQKLCENIVLYDRLCFMQEEAEAQSLDINVYSQKILNEKLSPRCFVLIAEKVATQCDGGADDAGR